MCCVLTHFWICEVYCIYWQYRKFAGAIKILFDSSYRSCHYFGERKESIRPDLRIIRPGLGGELRITIANQESIRYGRLQLSYPCHFEIFSREYNLLRENEESKLTHRWVSYGDDHSASLKISLDSTPLHEQRVSLNDGWTDVPERSTYLEDIIVSNRRRNVPNTIRTVNNSRSWQLR